MLVEQSQFSKLPKKQLVFISEKLIDEDFPIGNPYDINFDSAYNILKDVSKYFSINANNEDVEFFAKFLEINQDLIAELFANNKEKIKDKELIEQLKIPKLKSFKVSYEVWGGATLTEKYNSGWDSYDEDWIEHSMSNAQSEGSWSFYDGDFDTNETEDFEADNFQINNIREISPQIIESVYTKLVVENTKDIIDNLDREALIKLRNIINQKLSS